MAHKIFRVDLSEAAADFPLAKFLKVEVSTLFPLDVGFSLLDYVRRHERLSA